MTELNVIRLSMSPLSELHNDWLGCARLSGVLFLMNDYVEVIS